MRRARCQGRQRRLRTWSATLTALFCGLLACAVAASCRTKASTLSSGGSTGPPLCCPSDTYKGCSIGCSTDADCLGAPCAELAPGGLKICLLPPCPTECVPAPGIGTVQCCPEAGCGPGSECIATWLGCDPMAAIPECSSTVDACTTDADCGDGGTCLPVGAFGSTARQCAYLRCKSDADCTEHPGGRCIFAGDINECTSQIVCTYNDCDYFDGLGPPDRCDGGTCMLDDGGSLRCCPPSGCI
jgi:hypothetical protein